MSIMNSREKELDFVKMNWETYRFDELQPYLRAEGIIQAVDRFYHWICLMSDCG